MNYWLMKSEPEVVSFEDLLLAKARTTGWEGVRNYQARNFLRDVMKKGDRVLFYHSNTDEPAVVGIAEVVREGYVDRTALDPASRYFDEKAKQKGESPWYTVDVRALMTLSKPVTRAVLQTDRSTQTMMVLRRGARLSVQPVTAAEFEAVCRLGIASPIR